MTNVIDTVIAPDDDKRLCGEVIESPPPPNDVQQSPQLQLDRCPSVQPTLPFRRALI